MSDHQHTANQPNPLLKKALTKHRSIDRRIILGDQDPLRHLGRRSVPRHDTNAHARSIPARAALIRPAAQPACLPRRPPPGPVGRARLPGHHRGGPLFERSRAACDPAGLYTEEYDLRQRQLRGNLPQAFVHAGMLECTVRVSTGPPELRF